MARAMQQNHHVHAGPQQQDHNAHEAMHQHKHRYGKDKDTLLQRMRKIEGQSRGIQRMIEEDRYCPEIMAQIASVHEALRSVARELMRNHLRHCVAHAIRSGGAQAEASYDELVELFYATAR